MRKIKVTVAPPVLTTILKDNPDLQNVYQLEFIATSYRILNRVDGLDDPKAIVAESLKNEQEKEEKIFSIEMPETAFLYVTTKHHFRITAGDRKGQELETEWGGIVPISKHDNRLKVSDVLIATPVIYFTEKNGVLNIETSKYNLYSGPGEHASSSYVVEDTNNNPIFKRDKDEDNLLGIETPIQFEDGKMYLVRASHNSSTGGNSNFGAEFFNNYSAESKQFEFECGTDFVSNRKFYYRIKTWNAGFVCYKLEVVNKSTGKAEVTLSKETRLSHYIVLGYKSNDPEVLQEYDFYITGTFKQPDGKLVDSLRTLVHTDALGVNRLYPYDTGTVYIEKFDNTGKVITSGITCSTFRELFDGNFIGVDFVTNALYLFRNNNGTLVKAKKLYDFPNKIDLSYVNVAQTYDATIVVDAAEFDGNSQTSAIFYFFEYNDYRQELKLLKKVSRYDERYCTSMSNSLALTGEGEMWYVPAYQTNGKNSDRVQLKLRRVNLKDYTIDKEMDLPFAARYNVSLVADKDGGVYLFGGSNSPRYNTEKDILAEQNKDTGMTSEEYWHLENKTVYKLIRHADSTKDYLEPWTSIPAEVPLDCYCWHSFLRRDGNIVMFNSVHSGSQLSYSNYIIFDPYLKTMSINKMNGFVNDPFRTNIVFNSGNIRRISSGIRTEQVSITYISNTKAADLIGDLNIDLDKSDVLQVLENETIVIEDIYKYNNIKITGNGILKWIRPQGITILTSKDLIVNRDRNLKTDSFNTEGYRSILILDGTQCTFL